MKTHRSGRDGASGEMAERSKAAVSKIAVRATVPRVRIPLSPPFDMRMEFSTIVLDSPVSFEQYKVSRQELLPVGILSFNLQFLNSTVQVRHPDTSLQFDLEFYSPTFDESVWN